jgi:hypothetical protein
VNTILLKWCIAAAIAIGCLFGAYQHGVNVTNAKRDSDDNAALAKANAKVAEAEGKARAIEDGWRKKFDELGADTEKQIEAAKADAADADAASNRLRKQTERLTASLRSCPAGAATSEGGETRGRAAMVLSDVLSRMDARARELAAAYDRSRIAGSACQSAYDAIRNNQ